MPPKFRPYFESGDWRLEPLALQTGSVYLEIASSMKSVDIRSPVVVFKVW